MELPAPESRACFLDGVGLGLSGFLGMGSVRV